MLKGNIENYSSKRIGRLPSKLYLDFSIFRNRKLTIFESLIKFLKEEKRFTYHRIGLVLGRNERNIWTVYNRTKRKN